MDKKQAKQSEHHGDKLSGKSRGSVAFTAGDHLLQLYEETHGA